MNSGSRSSAINILFTLTILFYLAAIALAMTHASESIIDHAWGAFEGMSGALLLILKADSDHSTPPNPTLPAPPA